MKNQIKFFAVALLGLGVVVGVPYLMQMPVTRSTEGSHRIDSGKHKMQPAEASVAADPIEISKRRAEVSISGGRPLPNWIRVEVGLGQPDLRPPCHLSMSEMNDFLNGAFGITLPPSTRAITANLYKVHDTSELVPFQEKLNGLSLDHKYLENPRFSEPPPSSPDVDWALHVLKIDEWTRISFGGVLAPELEFFQAAGAPWTKSMVRASLVPQLYNAPSPVYWIRFNMDDGIMELNWWESHDP
jgi:hypothetical protein